MLFRSGDVASNKAREWFERDKVDMIGDLVTTSTALAVMPAAKEKNRITIVNGAAARHFHAGDRVIVAAFAVTDETITPRMIVVDEQNRFKEALPGHEVSEVSMKILSGL